MLSRIVTAVANTTRREWQQMLRRPIFFVASAGVMVFCYVFFLSFLKDGKPIELPAGIVDLDQSYVSRLLARNLDATPQTKIVRHYNSYPEARGAVQRGEIYGFILVQRHFESNLLARRCPTIEVYANDAYLNAGSLLLKDMSYLSALGSGFMQMKIMDMQGVDLSLKAGLVQPVALDAHLVANPWMDYGIYLANMLLPGMLQLMVIILAIFTIGGEYKAGTGGRWMITANRSMFAALTGKLLPQTLLFMLLGLGGNLLLFGVMKYPVNGSMMALMLSTCLLVLSSQAIGIFIAGLFPELSFSLSIGAFYGLFGLTFSGFSFPIEGMPAGVQMLSNFFPLRYYFRIYVGQALNGAELRYSLLYFACMLAFCLLPLLIWRRLKKASLYPAYPKS